MQYGPLSIRLPDKKIATHLKGPSIDILNIMRTINVNQCRLLDSTRHKPKSRPSQLACPTVINDQITVILEGQVAVVPIGFVPCMGTFRNPLPCSHRVIQKATVADDEPGSTRLPTGKGTTVRLITISNPNRMSVIPDNKIAIALQLQTKTPAG
ncbi:hypothetical protein BKM17_11445 [Pseudomonas syringae group genomosp. 3]|nr:hypothetical protein BKM17_11445 [Pseudomonas syringae group genomosp. 3]